MAKSMSEMVAGRMADSNHLVKAARRLKHKGCNRGHPRWFSESDREPYKDAYKYRIIERDSEMAIVGERGHAFKASRVVFTKRSGFFGFGSSEVAAEWVFFSRRGIDEIWTVIRDVGELGEDDFKVVLSSFRWLNNDYFRSLPR